MRKIHESDISLTPTQERLLGYIAAQTTISGAAQATKKELSQLMGCSVKTIDRAITRMSREGLIKSSHATPKTEGSFRMHTAL